VCGDCQGCGTASPGDLFQRNRRADRVHIRTTIFLGDAQAEQSERAHFAHRVPIELTRHIHIMGFRLHFLRDEIMNGFLPGSLFLD
jgi:hypothetical protein